MLASLNHPNIAAIHGLEEVQGAKYLVLEFVDGRTLGDVLKEGALPLAETMAIARQIADALSAAHERGIIHRDLKPGNVMVTAEGVVKVLDFGLGKALEAEAVSETANSPTMTMAATQAGIILGTAGYMSPEQAKGRAAVPCGRAGRTWRHLGLKRHHLLHPDAGGQHLEGLRSGRNRHRVHQPRSDERGNQPSLAAGDFRPAHHPLFSIDGARPGPTARGVAVGRDG
ncbi:MAG: serine/threonine protein kinase [Acidobacteria bacterium]|nr:serine/threonine protein kinase [Acidobacteriota bacterium]